MDASLVVGIDTGGTFTDLVAVMDGRLRVHKVLSTPDDPARAVLAGLKVILDEAEAGAGRKRNPAGLVTYSSTVATNALLERKGARVLLLTNAGFEDLIEIARQNRNDLYALAPERPEPLIPRAMRIGVAERSYFDGKTAFPLTPAELARVRRTVGRLRPESIAICLLHSYANRASEDRLARAVGSLGVPVSVSNRILAEYREYERLSTTVVNAYVAPRMSSHLERLQRDLRPSRLRVMQSNGSAIGVKLARDEPVRTILSGPAAGVIGAVALVRATGVERFITFDMGGTSTDVSLFDGRAAIRTLSYPGGYAVRAPVIDIHTVGAGGGSIASVDAGGSLRVGPESAGADPGPACYGRGDAPTVTDANLVAGRLVAENFLGGAMRLYPERAAKAIAGLGRAMRRDEIGAASGVIRVVNANMERAVRVITVERGFYPRDFALIAFGGAGPMHACELALDLGMRRVVLPQNPGLLCAWGALQAPLGREYSLTVRESAPDYRRLVERAAPMAARAVREICAEGARRAQIRTELFADIRYRGQSYEIEVRLTPRFAEQFHAAHRRTFGHAAPDAAIEAVNLRLRATAPGVSAAPARLRSRARPAPVRRVPVHAGGRRRPVPVYERDPIGEGARIRGPAIIVELSATAYVAPEFTLRADGFGNLHLEA
jgi:N-methylhydantoinase A/oxoprolinase/acetone carboxylase beta subunit